MSNIDKRALREAVNAANAASWGYWESYKPHKGARGYEVKVGVKAVAQHCLKVDSVFIAAANPTTVLALLDELEAKDRMEADLLNIISRHTIELGWGEKPITLAELIISREGSGSDALDAIRATAAGKGEAS